MFHLAPNDQHHNLSRKIRLSLISRIPLVKDLSLRSLRVLTGCRPWTGFYGQPWLPPEGKNRKENVTVMLAHALNMYRFPGQPVVTAESRFTGDWGIGKTF